MSILKVKIECLPSWDAIAGTLSIMTPFLGAKFILAGYVRAGLFFWTL